MEFKLEKNNRTYLYRVLCILTLVVSLLPVACDYIMSGGRIAEWIARVQELAVSPLQLFPSAEILSATSIKENAMDSNLWLLFSGLLYRLSNNMVLTYRMYMLVIQIGTFIFTKLFFERFFDDRPTRIPAFFGILLYMTCPYRIFICYDLADLSLAAAWMVFPLYAWALLGMLRKDKMVRNIFFAAISLAGIAYTDVVCFFAVSGITLIVVICYRKVLPVTAIVAGGLLFLPGLYRLLQYLFTDAYQNLNMPVRSIMQNGYRVGQFFTSYAFRDENPGMGIGMLTCLLLGLWLWFVEGIERRPHKEWFFTGIALMLLVFSTRYFPWEMVQRVGIWALKLVSMINTPAVFFGMAMGCLCVPAASSVDHMAEHENKVLAFAIPLFVLSACIGLCVYQCNMLTYSRLPLALP